MFFLPYRDLHFFVLLRFQNDLNPDFLLRGKQGFNGKDGINLQNSRSGVRLLQLNLKDSVLLLPKPKRQLYKVEGRKGNLGRDLIQL